MGEVSYVLDMLRGAIAFRNLMSLPVILGALVEAGRKDSERALQREVGHARTQVAERKRRTPA